MSLAIATATLARGTRFLAAGLGEASLAPRAITGVNHAKVIANGLRELDRFLNVLIDEVAAATRPPGLDLVQLARLRNTPNKLRLLRSALALESPDHGLLRAVGRTRACLFYTAGIVRRADMPRDAPAMPHLRTGKTLAMTPRDLAAICALYDRIAAELIAAGAATRPV